MSEVVSQKPLIQQNLLGEFHPVVTPELALQTYVYFGSDPSRQTSKDEFSKGNSYHLEMDFPLLDSDFDEAKRTLCEMKEMAALIYGPNSLTASSIGYRLEEVDFLQSARTLTDETLSDLTDRTTTARVFVEQTERLYGAPDQELVDSIAGTIKHMYTSKDPRIIQLWDDIENGFQIKLNNGTSVEVVGIDIATEFKALPSLTEEAQFMLRKEWQLLRPGLLEAQALIGDIAAVNAGLDIDYDKRAIEFSGVQLASILRIGARAIAEQYTVDEFDVILDPNGSAASWESGLLAVKVGANRSPSMSKWEKVIGTVPHEAVHGLKSMNGLQSGEPAMATGVFSEDADGNWVSYLTYEEGNNKLGESLLMSRSHELTINNDFSSYLLAGLVYRGYDDRQVAEIMKKFLFIEKFYLDPDANAVDVENEVTTGATTLVERFFRGTNPSSEVYIDGHLPIYTKDLAYFQGRLIAISDWNAVVERSLLEENPQAYLHREFELRNMGKIDPTEPSHYSAAETAYAKL